jgi:hypothetical protein
VVVAGGGVAPRIGLRIGASLAHGAYAVGDELTTAAFGNRRRMTMAAFEAEYAFGYTKLAGELVRNRMEARAGMETAYAWFVQGTQTLAPRIFVAARQEGSSAPPLRTGTVPATRTTFRTSETTIGYHILPELTLRASYLARKPYTRRAWDHQAGASVVWSRRWW